MLDVGKPHARRGLLRAITVVLGSLAMLLAMFGLSASPAAAQDTLVVVDDDGGPNDPNGDGQNDLTQFGRDDSDPDTILIKWSWDEPSTIQGGNASNACAMFDTDGDGNVNYSFCLEVSYGDPDGDGVDDFYITDSGDGTDSVADFPAWIECSDAKDDRCTQPNRLADPYNGDLLGSSCTIMITATDPFPAEGNDSPNDLMATCEISRDLIPDGGELINVCSYPSAGNDGNNNPFDCVVTPGSWFLVVEKVAPDGTTQAFDFSVSGTTGDDGTLTIVGSGSTDLLPATGQASVSETVPDGWQLDSATCSNGDDPSAVQGSPGQTVTCTFTNSLSQGTLTLLKVVEAGADPTPLAADSVTLSASDAGGTEVMSGTTGVSASLTPGTYSVAETLGDAEYALTSIVCDGADATATGEVAVVAGADSTCTFTNTFQAAPALSVDKVFTGIEDNEASDGDTDAELGETLNYTITATNDGNVPLTNVVVSDSLTGESTTCASVPVGGTCVLNASYVVTADDVAAGNVANTGTADSEETGPDSDDEDVPVVSNPALSVDKVFTGIADNEASDGDTDAELGETLNYTITATNDGDIALTNVVVSDSLTGESTTCASVPVGGTCVLNASYVVTADDVAAGQVLNTGTADSEETGPDSDDEDVPVVANPAYTIDKELVSNADEDGNGEVSLDDTLTYKVTVTNTGDIAMDITVSDSLITPSSTSCGDVAPQGGTCELVGTYVVDQDDVDAGEILNTGTGTSNLLDPIEDDLTVDVPQTITLSIDKLTNGADDNTILAGESVTWTYQVTNTGNTTLDSLVVTDSDPAVTVSCPATTLAPGESTTCTASGTAVAGDYTNTGTADADGPQDQPATGNDDSGYFGASPSVSIDKKTNGADGLTILEGETVTWTYEVTNTGNVALSDVVVSDDQEGPICTVSLAVGESTTCEATGTAGSGAYANTGSADGSYTDDSGNSTPVGDSDDSDYFGASPSVSIDKKTNGIDSGATVLEGETVTWTYEVTNTGNVDLVGVVVSDDQEGVICTVDLAAGESTTCQATGVAGSGAYANTGSADTTFTDDSGNSTPVGDSDDSDYFGASPSVSIDKVTNGADGLTILEGETVTWTYTITNTGNVALTDVVVSDDQEGAVCTVSLAVGESTTCEATGVAGSGAYANTGSADTTFTDDSGNSTPVGDSDDSDYFGASPSVSIDKVTNGADGQTILEGSAVTWTYTITNTGNVALTDVVVSDDQEGAVCTVSLAVGESTTCEATGVAGSGAYANTGSADTTFTDDSGNSTPVGATDDSDYFGASPSFTIDKVTTTSTGTSDGEFAVEGDAITWTYTIVNTGNVDLTGIEVTDSVEGAVCTVDVAVGETATCTLDGTAVRGTYTNTGIGDGTYTDDVGNSEDLNDTDDSGYTGINNNQPSIQFPERINIEEVGDNGFSTTLTITNESDGLEADTVVISDFNIIVESGKGRRATVVDVNCTVNGQATGDLVEPISFTGASTDLEIECFTADGSRLRGDYKITFEAQILNRDRTFSTSTSVRF